MVQKTMLLALGLMFCTTLFPQQPSSHPLSAKIRVLGDVAKPGTYTLTVPMTVLRALVEAGGFREAADVEEILIVRGERLIKFNYAEVIQGTNPAQNIPVTDGDVILIRSDADRRIATGHPNQR
jgi:protein involved in polysaccharide export with SLBB domain